MPGPQRPQGPRAVERAAPGYRGTHRVLQGSTLGRQRADYGVPVAAGDDLRRTHRGDGRLRSVPVRVGGYLERRVAASAAHRFDHHAHGDRPDGYRVSERV